MLIKRWALACVAAAASSLLADSANLRVVTERSLPDGWTAPELTAPNQGSSSYVPSVPSSTTTRDVGTVLDVGSATVHTSGRSRDAEATTAHVEYRYRLVLPGGTAVALSLGTWKSIGTDAVRLTRLPSGDFALQYRSTGRILRLRSQAGSTPPATAGRTAPP